MVRYIAAVLFALGCLAAASCGAWAQPVPTAAFRVAIVDIEAVGQRFERKIQEEKNLQAWSEARKRLLDQLSQLPFLTADEWKEAVQIYSTAEASWTQAQKDREKALRDQSLKREKDYKDLEAKVNRTAEERDKFTFLQDIWHAREGELKQEAAKADQELRDKQDALGVALMEPVQKIIEQIAAEKGYALVLTKAVVFLGGEDITDLVVERVNAAAKAAAEGGAAKPAGGAGDKPPAPAGGKP